MQHTSVKKRLATSALWLFLFLAAFADKAKAGLDYYEIYLGKTLLFKRYVNQPLSLEKLSLSHAKDDEQLVIRYYQCNAPGKLGANRRISLQDDKGNPVKEWSYPDAEGTKTGMTIPVKELLALIQKSKSSSLVLVYTAKDKQESQTLAYVKGGAKPVGYLPQQQKGNVSHLLYLQTSL